MRNTRLCLAAATSVLALGLATAGAGLAASAASAAPIAATPAAAPKPTGPTCGGSTPPKPGGGTYVCTFTEDFNGRSFDTSKWIAQDTSFSGFTDYNRDCFVNRRENLSVANGRLALTSRIESAPFVCKSPSGDFETTSTAASLGTYGRFTQTYGRFAFRAKMPATTAQGAHSALWLYPQKHTYGQWPHSGEIDVAEWFSVYPDKVYPSVHYAGEDTSQSTGYDCVVATASSDFHEYAVEWTPTEMKFFYDGNLCFQHTWTPAAPLVAPQPFDQPFQLVMTQGFGPAFNTVTADTAQSATMYVDWVRVWK